MPTASALPAPRALIRPLTPADGPLVSRGFELLSSKSRYRRWGTEHVRVEAALAWITELDGERCFAVGACSGIGGNPIGVARYVGAEPSVAELAVTVVDSAQGHGFGRLLVAHLLPYALSNGFLTLRASIRLGNTPAIRLMRGIGGIRRGWSYGGVLEFEARLRREQVHHWPEHGPSLPAGHRRAG